MVKTLIIFTWPSCFSETLSPIKALPFSLFQSAKDSQQTSQNLKQGHWLRRECVWCYATLYAS